MSISPEFGSPTLIFKLWELFSGYQTMHFALEELENDSRSLKVKAGEPNTLLKCDFHNRGTESTVMVA